MVRFGFLLLLSAGVIVWIPVLGWVAAPLLFVAGVLVVLAGIVKGDL